MLCLKSASPLVHLSNASDVHAPQCTRVSAKLLLEMKEIISFDPGNKPGKSAGGEVGSGRATQPMVSDKRSTKAWDAKSNLLSPRQGPDFISHLASQTP